jgi:hypothetical protein
MGDGVLAYFGYPKAHEDDAERAVQAGLAGHLPLAQASRAQRAQYGPTSARPAGVRSDAQNTIRAPSAFALGMAIHNERLANQHVPEARKSSIYYCATGHEIPMYEPCKEMKGQRDI